MKIYETRVAPNPRRVRIFLAEKGIAVPFHEVDLMKGELRTPEMTKLNRFQRVPFLVLDDGTTLGETMAICRYFEDINPLPALFGKGALEIARVEMWNRHMELGLLFNLAGALRHGNPRMAHLEQPQVPAFAEACKPKAQEMMRVMDDELSRKPFIAGEKFTVADITALCAMDFLKPARVERPDGLKNLERWYGDVSARPSAKA